MALFAPSANRPGARQRSSLASPASLLRKAVNARLAATHADRDRARVLASHNDEYHPVQRREIEGADATAHSGTDVERRLAEAFEDDAHALTDTHRIQAQWRARQHELPRRERGAASPEVAAQPIE